MHLSQVTAPGGATMVVARQGASAHVVTGAGSVYDLALAAIVFAGVWYIWMMLDL